MTALTEKQASALIAFVNGPARRNGPLVTCVVCKRRLPRDKALELQTTDGWMCPKERRSGCVEVAVQKGARG